MTVPSLNMALTGSRETGTGTGKAVGLQGFAHLVTPPAPGSGSSPELDTDASPLSHPEIMAALADDLADLREAVTTEIAWMPELSPAGLERFERALAETIGERLGAFDARHGTSTLTQMGGASPDALATRLFPATAADPSPRASLDGAMSRIAAALGLTGKAAGDGAQSLPDGGASAPGAGNAETLGAAMSRPDRPPRGDGRPDAAAPQGSVRAAAGPTEAAAYSSRSGAGPGDHAEAAPKAVPGADLRPGPHARSADESGAASPASGQGRGPGAGAPALAAPSDRQAVPHAPFATTVLQAAPDPGSAPSVSMPLAPSPVSALASPASPVAAAAPPAPVPTAEPPVLDQVRRAGVTAGRTRIELAPDGLGALEIDVSAGEAGQLRVVVRAENAAVLAMLRSDRAALASTLGESGIALGEAGLDFESFARDRGGREAAQWPTPGPQGAAGAAGEPVESAPIPYRPSAAPGRLDILT